MEIPATILWNEDCFKGCLVHILWAPFIQGQTQTADILCIPVPVNNSWVFNFWSEFLWQQPNASNESSVLCSCELPHLSCATLYANPHNKRLEMEDTCKPHVLCHSSSFLWFKTRVSQLTLLCNDLQWRKNCPNVPFLPCRKYLLHLTMIPLNTK